MPRNVLITGASGLLGHHLSKVLEEAGFQPLHLGRSKKQGAYPSYTWNIAEKTIDQEAVDRADIIIHLAGTGVVDKRWNAARKKEIISSRVDSAALLAMAVARRPAPLPLVISASGVGWYGMVTSDKLFNETDPPAADFLGECCREWEASAAAIPAQRTVILRIGAVLARDGGAFPKLAAPVKWGFGAPLGNGQQWFPWIHVDDLCGIFLHSILHEKMQGVYNAAAPAPLRNRPFTRLLGKVLHRPVFLPGVPRFLLKIFLGELEAVVTTGSRASVQKLLDAGYVFRFPEAEAALQDLVSAGA